jgi:hypothetical protein
MTTFTHTTTTGRSTKWLKPLLASALLAAQSLTLGAMAEPSEPEHKYRPGASPQQRSAPPAARQAPPTNSIGRLYPAPAPQATRQAPPAQVYRQAPPAQVYRQAPQPSYSPPPQRPRYEAERRDGGRRYNNRGVAIGVGAAIIGATLGYRYYRGPNRDNVYDRCDRNFSEFDYDTGTFTNEDGDRELCPYLRAYVD